MVFQVTVKNRMMIAHSLNSEEFGPAQNMHGATYEIEITFYSQSLDENNIIINIDQAHKLLKQCLTKFNYKNLDELPTFQNEISTSEYIAYVIWKDIVDQVVEAKKSLAHIEKLGVLVHESRVASAGYEGLVQR